MKKFLLLFIGSLLAVCAYANERTNYVEKLDAEEVAAESQGRYTIEYMRWYDLSGYCHYAGYRRTVKIDFNSNVTFSLRYYPWQEQYVQIYSQSKTSISFTSTEPYQTIYVDVKSSTGTTTYAFNFGTLTGGETEGPC